MKKVNYGEFGKDILCTLLAVVVIPSLIFWLIGQFWFIDRAIFNIDYLVVCLVLIPFGAVSVAIGMASVLVIDIIFSFAPAYHFSLTSVLHSINDLFSLEPGFLAIETGKVIAIVLLGTFSMFLSIRKAESKGVVMVTCLASAILLTLLDMGLSANAIRERDGYAINTNIAASSMKNLRLALSTADNDAMEQQFQPAESAAQVLRTSRDDTGGDFQTFILVTVESLGEFSSRELQGFQMEPILSLQNHAGIVLNTGTVPFEGSTVPGELRELCGIRMLAVHPDISILPADECLPRVLGRSGYRTWAIHGFIGTLFSRNRWYPALEFDNIWFAPELDDRIEGANRCGIAFHGICDTDVWKMITGLKSDDPAAKKFIYWLTLTAHLPVENRGETGSQACSMYEELAGNAELCSLVLQQRQLLTEIANSARRGELNDTRIVVVGDHSPPFLDNETRSLFSLDDVPYVDIRIPADR